MKEELKILITNDDGIGAEGIKALTEWAGKLGTVTVCAPKTQQSGKSHSITIHDSIEIVKTDDKVETWRVDSSPADCVRWGTLGLNRTYDFVFSGINRGYNLGDDIAYSGTCGAIFEAGYRNIKGIAFSTDVGTLEEAKVHLDRVWEYFKRNKLFEQCNLYNVNIPPKPVGIRITKQGSVFYTDDFRPIGENLYEQNGYCVHESEHNLELDTDATTDGWITITPLSIARGNAIKIVTID